MADLTRVADNVCIYWDTTSTSFGRCVANKYKTESSITCYNSGGCDGSGTCRNCSSYDVGGLKFSHKNTKDIYGLAFRMVWDDATKSYVPVSSLTESDASTSDYFSDTLTAYQQTHTYNFNGIQLPMNLAIYNLRAKFKKCCNWVVPPLEFRKDKSGNLWVSFYCKVQVGNAIRATYVETPYSTSFVDNYIKGTSKLCGSPFCTQSLAQSWWYPFSTDNQTAYGCNGAKPECPYYTGPKWSYCIDSKMQIGDRISAAQIQELRYYSSDWASMTNPQSEWNKRFKHPEIWAWTGKYEHTAGNETIYSDDNPMVRRVYISSFTGEEPSIGFGEEVSADIGLAVEGISVRYPTLIQELNDVENNMRVVWPQSNIGSPYLFRGFNREYNRIRVYVDTPYSTTVYAVNLTKRPQGGSSDSSFIESMLNRYPEDILTDDSAISTGGLVGFNVSLEYNIAGNGYNTIKFFTRDPTSSSGEYLTAYCYIRYKFYHAMLAQTIGEDSVGHREIQPWIDRFERIKLEAQIMNLTGNVRLDQVLWDAHAGSKITWYSIEEVISDELQSNWHALSCNIVAITFSDTRCNSVTPWYISGSSTAFNSPLGLRVDRSANPRATETSAVLQVLFRSTSGDLAPSNVVFAAPAAGTKLSTALDPKYDRIYATYAVTEYKQGPVEPADVIKLKYPTHSSLYIDELPIEVSVAADSSTFTVNGLFVKVQKITGSGQDISVETEKFYSLDDVKYQIYKRLKNSEDIAVSSFLAGGLNDSLIETSGYIFSAIENQFNSDYSGYTFVSDGISVTLEALCDKLAEIRNHEGSYSFMAIFKDETGRPIGVKRIAMLLQSAIAETRDVEIYYKWEMNRVAWVIYDSLLLLARHNEPMAQEDYEGVDTYTPKCGDHSEVFLQSHELGTPGPMWYPYIRCIEPHYHQTGWDLPVQCQNYVEGFGSSYDGKRWSYWERMRGPDILRTISLAPIYLVGCFYREVSFTIQTVNDQRFTGYTRIRSCHPNGPFSKDRETVRLNRHFLKRNLKVRNEVIQNANDPNVIVWNDNFEQLLFSSTSAGVYVERVGDEKETPIWVHLCDGVSEVSLTTESVQHPFAHYLLNRVSTFNFAEVFEESRLKLSSVVGGRDLTRSVERNPVGTLIYRPGEPGFIANTENYSDIIPIFNDRNIGWAWLERQKDVERGTPRVTGVYLYNPTQTVWRTDRESAVHSDEGTHELSYTKPEFTFNGVYWDVSVNPTLQWYGGFARTLSWNEGSWLDTNTVYDYSVHSNKDNFVLFGQSSTSTSSSFLVDSSGIHKYVIAITDDGITYGHTCRGLGVNKYINCADLPYTVSDYSIDYITDITTLLRETNNRFAPGRENTHFDLLLKGYYYVDRIEFDFSFGPAKTSLDQDIRYDIPAITVIGRKYTNNTTYTDYYITQTAYEKSSTSIQYEEEGPGGERYAYQSPAGLTYKTISCSVSGMYHKLALRFSTLLSDALAYINSIKIWYRKPTDRVESVVVYERRVNVSSANTGSPDYRNMLYYYNRTVPEYGDSLAYTVSSQYDRPSIKFNSRSVKDVILEYEYYDPTGTRFAYKDEVKPENNPEANYDADGVLAIPGVLDICTKGRTIFAGPHVNDCPQWVSNVGGESSANRVNMSSNTVANRSDTAINEVSSCLVAAGSSAVGRNKLGESVQECLYEEAKDKAGGDFTAVYYWFWHPDEVSFWNSLGVDTTKFSPTLTLKSKVADMHKLFEHEDFGCSSDMSVPYFDGRIHPISRWQALGHRLYAGNPMFNMTCYDIVIFKIGDHLGETTYGTTAYGDNLSGNNWPFEEPKDAAHYLSAGQIESRSNYIGGSIGGAGIAGFFIEQAALNMGVVGPQRMAFSETEENIISGRAEATRAEGS